MIRIVVLIMIILMALDGIFRDGKLLEVFLSQEMHIPFFVKSAYFIVMVGASALLFHAIIWEFNIMPKPEEKKTPLQIKREEEEAERIRIEEEKIAQEEAEKKRIERELRRDEEMLERANEDEGRKYFL